MNYMIMNKKTGPSFQEKHNYGRSISKQESSTILCVIWTTQKRNSCLDFVYSSEILQKKSENFNVSKKAVHAGLNEDCLLTFRRLI